MRVSMTILVRAIKGLLCGFFLAAFTPLPACGPVITAAVPSVASHAGFGVRTFYSNFQGDVDLQNTRAPGYNWYPYNFFGAGTAKLSQIQPMLGGGINLLGDTTGPNGEISSVSANGSTFIGQAFGGGGYFEAVLKFNPYQVLANASNPANGFPAWWTLAAEKITGNDQWPGQATGYTHYIEPDIMEYKLATTATAITNVYLGTFHDWYGIYAVTCYPSPFCQVESHPNGETVPVATDFTQYHAYGMLWVPATATTSGYVQYYFDRAPVGALVSWTQYTNQPPTPVGQPWVFGIIDLQHPALILGTGLNQPMQVQSVSVWQRNGLFNSPPH